MDNPTMEELEEEARIQLKQRVHIWCKLYGLNLHSHMKQVDEHTGTRTSNIYDEIINDPSKIKFGDWLIKLLINKRSSWLLHILLRHKDISLRKHTGKCCRVYIGDYNYIDIEFVFVNDEALQNKPETNPLTTNNLINIEIGAFILDNESWEKGYNMYNVNDLFHHGTRCTDLLTIQNIISEHNNNSKTLDIYLHAQEMITTPKPLHPHLVKGNLIRFHCKPFSWNLYDTEICSITNNSNNSNTRTIVQETEVQDNVINNSTERLQKKRKAVVAEAEDNAINTRTEQQSQKKRKANNNSIDSNIDNNIDNNPSDMTEEQENNNVDKLSLKSPPDNHTEEQSQQTKSNPIVDNPSDTMNDQENSVDLSLKSPPEIKTSNKNSIAEEEKTSSNDTESETASIIEKKVKFVKAVSDFIIVSLYAQENKEYHFVDKEMDEFPEKVCYYAPYCRSHPDICKGHHKDSCNNLSRTVFIPAEKEFNEVKSTFAKLRENYRNRKQRTNAKLPKAIAIESTKTIIETSKATLEDNKKAPSPSNIALALEQSEDGEDEEIHEHEDSGRRLQIASNSTEMPQQKSKKTPFKSKGEKDAAKTINHNDNAGSLKSPLDEAQNKAYSKSSDNLSNTTTADRASQYVGKVKVFMSNLLEAARSKKYNIIDEEVDKFPEKLCFYAPYCSSHPDDCKGHHKGGCTNFMLRSVFIPNEKEFNESKSKFAELRRNSKKRRQRASAKLQGASKSTKTPKKTEKETPRSKEQALSPSEKNSKREVSVVAEVNDEIKETKHKSQIATKSTKMPQQISKQTPIKSKGKKNASPAMKSTDTPKKTSKKTSLDNEETLSPSNRKSNQQGKNKTRSFKSPTSELSLKKKDDYDKVSTRKEKETGGKRKSGGEAAKNHGKKTKDGKGKRKAPSKSKLKEDSNDGAAQRSKASPVSKKSKQK